MKMVYVGPSEWKGPVYLEHGKTYNIRPLTKPTSKSKTYQVEVEDFVETHAISYRTKEEMELYWKAK